MKLISSWSGGKDSCYALMRALEKGHELSALLNMMNDNGKVSRSHGLPLSILNQQARALGVPLSANPAEWREYEANYISALNTLKKVHHVKGVVFGDIDLEPHRAWEEKVCLAANLKALLPLWQEDRKELVCQMIDSHINAIIVSCNTVLGESFLGRAITKELVCELEELGVDACGENGEYHTVVLDCPLFLNPIELPQFSTQTYKDYCFITWNR